MSGIRHNRGETTMSKGAKDAEDWFLRIMPNLNIVPPLDPDPDCGRDVVGRVMTGWGGANAIESGEKRG
jgi:hypothetical protein